MSALSLATMAPRSSYDRTSICLGEDFGTGRPKQHGVGEEIIAAAGAHEPGEDVEAHAFADFKRGIGAQPLTELPPVQDGGKPIPTQ